MDKSHIQERVYSLLSKYVKRDFGIKDDVFTNGFVNSMDAVELALQFEREFGIAIADVDAKDLRTVESITSFIYQRIR